MYGKGKACCTRDTESCTTAHQGYEVRCVRTHTRTHTNLHESILVHKLVGHLSFGASQFRCTRWPSVHWTVRASVCGLAGCRPCGGYRLVVVNREKYGRRRRLDTALVHNRTDRLLVASHTHLLTAAVCPDHISLHERFSLSTQGRTVHCLVG